MRHPFETLLPALALACALGAPGAAAVAGEAGDPLTALPVIDDAELEALSGRQGISLSHQDLTAITQGGRFEAGGDFETGRIDFGSSQARMSGFNNQAINTGNNSNVLSGMTVHLHLY